MLTSLRRSSVAALRALGSLLPAGAGRRHDPTRVIRPWRQDSARTHPSVGLTPQRALAYLHAADAGQPHKQFELYAEMLQKWPRLAAVARTRRLALSGLDWEITAAHRSGDTAERRRLAQEASDYCTRALHEVERFRDALDHLSSAVGFGLAVAELVWEQGRLVDVVPVPSGRLLADPHEPWRLRVLTEEEPSLGVPLDEHPWKWVVHQPDPTPGRYFEGGLLRASVLLYLAQNLSLKDWLVYSQIAGMPMRVAQFEPGTPEDDQRALLKMLEGLGTEAAAVFGKNIDLRFEQPARGGAQPYEPLQEYCNTEVTILWLGQHLTTEIGTAGSRAAAEVHDRVREDLLVDDIVDEGQTLRRDLLTPLVRARFGPEARVPRFRRTLSQAVDTRELAETLSVAVNQLGLRVSQGWVHEALGIPQPGENETVLGGEGRS